TAEPPLWSAPRHDNLLTPNSLPHGGAVLHPTFPAAAASVCQERESSLPSCAPPVRTHMLTYQTPLLPSIMVFTGPTPPLPLTLGTAAHLSSLVLTQTSAASLPPTRSTLWDRGHCPCAGISPGQAYRRGSAA